MESENCIHCEANLYLQKNGVTNIYLIILGISLLIIGIYIYLKSIVAVKKAYNQSKLITTGFFSYMRHPVYSSFVLLITPGIICFFNSWLLFLVPIIFYFIFRVYIKPEEDYCLKKFGENYAHYKRNVYAIIPKFKKYKPN